MMTPLEPVNTGRPEPGAGIEPWRRRRLSAAQIAILYLIGSACWIVFTDKLAFLESPDPKTNQLIQSVKGIFFVSCSATLLYLLIHRAMRDSERVAELMRIAHERYELAVAGSEEIVWDWDIVHDRTYWSGRLLESLGISPTVNLTESVVGREWESRLHPEDKDRVWAELQRHLDTDAPYDVEYRLRATGDGYRWFRSRGKAVRDASGKAVRMVGSMSDVTIKHVAEEKVRNSEARFRAIFEQNPHPMWIFDRAAMQILDVNDAAVRKYGYTLEEFRRLSLRDMCPPADFERLKKFVVTQDPDAPYIGEWKHIKKNGEVIEVLASTCSLPIEGGRRIRLGTFVDVTEQNRVAQALRDSEQRYRQIVETAAEGIWLVEKDWTTKFVNKKFADMLGLDPATMIGRHVLDFIPEESRGASLERMARRERGISEQHDFRFKRSDGTDLWTLINVQALQDEHGQFAGALAMLTDITDRRAAEETLRSERELFLAGPVIAWRWKNAPGWPVMFVSKNVSTLGYSTTDFTSGVIRFADIVHPADLPRISDEVSHYVSNSHATFEQEYRLRTGDGRWRWMKDYSTIQRDESGMVVGFAGYTIDSTERKDEERWQEDQRRVLAQLASNVELSVVLDTIVKAVQDQEPGMACSILSLEPDSTVRTLAAPNLPKAYSDAINGFTIGPSAGSCGTAMHRRARVIVTDIQRNPLWEQFKGVAAKHNLHACWSEPIIASDGHVLGSLAMYYQEPRTPNARELRLISVAAGLASIAIERGRAEKALRDSQQRLSMLVRSTPLGVIFWDTSFRIAEWNHGAETIFGYSSDEAIGMPGSTLVPEEVKPYVDQIWKKLSSNSGGTRGTNANIRKDGRTIYCEWYNSPLIDPGGKLLGVASVVEDITDRRAAQERQSFMLSELDHRVKNNLAAIMSLAQQTGRTTSSNEEFQRTFAGRIRALARMHDVLSRSNWRGVRLRMLVAQTLEAFSTTNRSEIQGEDIMLPARVVQAVSMALNELATNAAKYGSLSTPLGGVHVSWTLEPTEFADAVPGVHDLMLTWREHDGPPVETPTRRGFGTELIEGAVAFELHGRAKLEYYSGGLVCAMRFPLGYPEPMSETPENTGGFGASV
jgi:PAS domain S-box-containing protein